MKLLVTTTSSLEGYKILEYKGIVRGLVVHSINIAEGISTAFSSIAGGRNRSLIRNCEAARSEAFQQAQKEAMTLRTNAIIGLKYDSSTFGGFSEVLCYGTAVVVEKQE